MAESRQTTIRFSEPMYRRLEVAGQLTGLPINSIVVIACLEWLDEHQPMPAVGSLSQTQLFPHMGPPLGWRKGTYPFDRFTERSKRVLLLAQSASESSGQGYLGDEHLLIGLLEVGEGVAATALADLQVSAEKIRSQLGAAPASPPVTKLFPGPTSSMKSIIERAFNLARQAGKSQVGTGDLLAALVMEPNATTTRMLSALGISPDQVRSELDAVAAKSGTTD